MFAHALDGAIALLCLAAVACQTENEDGGPDKSADGAGKKRGKWVMVVVKAEDNGDGGRDNGEGASR